MYICRYLYTQTCIYEYTSTCTYVYMCTRKYIYMYINACMCRFSPVQSLLLYLSALPHIFPVPSNCTVAILAQGTNRADAVTQAFYDAWSQFNAKTLLTTKRCGLSVVT